MLEIRFFWKTDCPKCPGAKHVVRQLQNMGFDINEHQVDDADGLAILSYYEITSVPAILVLDEDDKIVKRWVSIIPSAVEISSYLTTIGVKQLGRR